MVLRIIRSWDDFDPAVLGLIKIPDEQFSNPGFNTHQEIETAWEDFLRTRPDCDSEFLGFLIHRFPMWEITEDPYIDMVVG